MALVYIVEDDESIREIEEIALKNSGYQVMGFGCAKDFYGKLAEVLPDLVLVDIMLPDENGNEIVRRLRTNKITEKLPIVMVTAKTSELDLIRGLDGGADDYIKKPFSVMELVSRVRALIRRTETVEESNYELDDLKLDDDRRETTIASEVVELTFKEYELLRYLLMNKNLVLHREKIMEKIWGTDFEGESRTLDMHIKTLRQKLGDYGSRIKTVRNVGYVIK